MAELTVDSLQEGVAPSFAALQAVSSSDVFDNDGNTMLLVKNDDTSNTTVTIPAQTTSFKKQGVGDVSRANLQLTVAAGTIRWLGPFSKAVFNNSAGQVTAQFSNITSVTAIPIALETPGQYAGG